MSEKKYVWLKLKDDFFEDDTIAYIEEQENGIEYSNFYLKLCLKSLKTDGKLIRIVGETVIPYDVKSLAKLTRVSTDTVRVALEMFLRVGLLTKLETGEIYLSQINELIGKETRQAEIMRRKRALEKVEIDVESNDVTPMLLECYENVTLEKEKEKEKDKDKEVDKEADKEPPSASATSKIIKNVKQNRIFFENDPELNQEFQYFIDMRNSMKPKPTEHAIDLLIKELEKLSTDNGCFNRDIAIEIVKQSTRSSWKGLFPPKEQRSSSTPQKGKTAQELDSFYGMAKSWAERNRDEQ